MAVGGRLIYSQSWEVKDYNVWSVKSEQGSAALKMVAGKQEETCQVWLLPVLRET